MPTVAFLVPPGVHLLDLAGPAQVFSNSLLPGGRRLLYLGESEWVAGEHGPAVAARVARNMVVHARRTGSQPQTGVMLRHRDHLADVVHRAQDIIDDRFAEPIPLPSLASRVGVSERTLTRLFTRATGVTPLRYQQALRVERAEHLAGQGWSLEAAARDVGFTDARMLRRLRAQG